MSGSGSHINDTIVSSLLLVGHYVALVNDDGEIVQIWQKNAYTHLLSIDQFKQFALHQKNVIVNCQTQKVDDIIYQSVEVNDFIHKYKFRILGSISSENNTVVVAEHISSKLSNRLSEDALRHALDVAGDGTWDVNINTQRITVSEKWCKEFGYVAGTVFSINEWTDLIHPDDISNVQAIRLNYFSGKTKEYKSEFRIRCADDSYRWVLSRGVIASYNPDGTPYRFAGTHNNITNIKSTEERFAATAQMLSRLINNLNDGIIVYDEQLHITYANEKFYEMFNIDQTKTNLIGLDFESNVKARMVNYLNPELFYNRTIDISKRMELVVNEEWELNDGKIYSRDFIPLKIGNSNKGVIWKFRDITAKKNVEFKLSAIRNFYESILNSIQADIVAYDRNGRYLFINPSAIKDKTLRDWMIGKTDEDYCKLRNKPAEMLKRRQEVLRISKEELRIVEWEEILINKDGDSETHLRYQHPIFDENGNYTMGIGYGLNITDRIKTQQALQTSNETFRSAFENSAIGMALVSPEGKWMSVNQKLCDIIGYRREELEQLSYTDITHPEDRIKVQKNINKLFSQVSDTYTGELRYVSKDNKIVYILQNITLVRTIEGAPNFFVSQMVDISSKKQMEFELRKKNNDLETTKESLIGKINQLEDLNHIIAHNLRGPAGNIHSIAESMFLKHQFPQAANALASAFTDEEAFRLIAESSESLKDSLATLIKVSEIKLNKEIKFDDCDFGQIIEDVCNQLQGTIFEKNALISKNLTVARISYPKLYLENIVYNLISNALKYSKSDRNPEISIITAKYNNRTVLKVKDNGIGIDLIKYGNRVFKLNEIFHEGYDSKGIGLFITKTQIESFGGSISVKSIPEEGSEFTVTF